jgi:hypothetical protein
VQPDENAAEYFFEDPPAYVLFKGNRTVVTTDSVALWQRYQEATADDVDPARLLAAAGGDDGTELLIALWPPLPDDVYAMAAHQLTGADHETAERLLAGVNAARFALRPDRDVPFSLALTTDSSELAREFEDRLAGKLAELRRLYEEDGRRELLADDLVPDTHRLIGELDRLVRGMRVERSGMTVEVRLSSPGGMPLFVELCLHEFARTSLEVQHTFQKVSDELMIETPEADAERDETR